MIGFFALAGCSVEAEQGAKCDDLGEEAEDACAEPGHRMFCFEDEGDLVWGSCGTPSCEPGQTESCTFAPEFGGGPGTRNCVFDSEGIPRWDDELNFEAGCNTPLVLSFDGAPVQMQTSVAMFDIDTVGACVDTDWPMAQTPWLALDVDHDGSIDSGAELFGSGMRMPDGHRARHGFEALAQLDSNGDGRISTSDTRFSDLVLWSDHDMDKRGTLAELEPLAHHDILSIELGYHVDPRCDDRGNCEVERATFRFVDRGGEIKTGSVVDLHLACQ